MDTDHSAAEAAFARLWGIEQGSRRGPRPTLSLERIVEAAFEIADSEGLAAVSMARVAERAGSSPMALYRHVRNKEELLIHLADRIVDEPVEIPAGLPWRAGLELWTRAQVDLVVARPWCLDLPLTTVLPGPRRLRGVDQGLGAMRELDLPLSEKLKIIGLLAQHVLGEARVQIETRRAAASRVRAEAGLPADTPERDLDPRLLARANPYHDFERVLGRLADPETYPHLAAAAARDGAYGPGSDTPPDTIDPDEDIKFGIDVVLDGVEAYVARRTAARRADR